MHDHACLLLLHLDYEMRQSLAFKQNYAASTQKTEGFLIRVQVNPATMLIIHLVYCPRFIMSVALVHLIIMTRAFGYCRDDGCNRYKLGVRR